MGALKDIGLDLEGETFYTSLVSSISSNIENSKSPKIEFLDLSIGFPVVGGGKEASDAWKNQALKENSDFKKNFIDSGFKPIFDLIDAIPPVNILKPIGIIDPTAPLLPITNVITDILSSIGIENPNEFFLTKMDKIIKKKDDLLKALDDIKKNGEEAIKKGIEKLAVIFNEIDSKLDIEKLKSKINEKIKNIKSVLSIPEIELPEPPYFSLPDLSDLKSFALTFFKFDLPNLDINIELDPLAYIETILNFNLDIPPIGVMFVEIAKIKIQMLIELSLGIPAFLKTAIDKIKELFLSGNFSLKEMIKSILDSVLNYFFEKMNSSSKIKKLIDNASTLVYVINTLIQNLVGSLVVSIVGIIFGKGLIMKSTAIGLGLLK